MSEIICYGGTTCSTRDKGRYTLLLSKALEEYETGCDKCEELKNEAQRRGLAKVVMSDEHIVEICSA
ncbi:MAG: hypothetical protein WC511_03825 [Candidatus Pacearchaeota archaeon]|jgi:hypothetical protein